MRSSERSWWKECRRLAFALLLAAGALRAATAAAQPVAEYQIKAAFVFNIARFAEWPPDAFPSKEAPLLLCVVGRDPFGTAFESVEGRMVGGRAFQVRRNARADDLRACQLLYVAETDERRVAMAIRAAGSAVLTIGDSDAFAESGGMVNLLLLDNRIQFDVNVPAVNRSSVRLSSQLLKLARSTTGPKGRSQ